MSRIQATHLACVHVRFGKVDLLCLVCFGYPCWRWSREISWIQQSRWTHLMACAPPTSSAGWRRCCQSCWPTACLCPLRCVLRCCLTSDFQGLLPGETTQFWMFKMLLSVPVKMSLRFVPQSLGCHLESASLQNACASSALWFLTSQATGCYFFFLYV